MVYMEVKMHMVYSWRCRQQIPPEHWFPSCRMYIIKANLDTDCHENVNSEKRLSSSVVLDLNLELQNIFTVSLGTFFPNTQVSQTGVCIISSHIISNYFLTNIVFVMCILRIFIKCTLCQISIRGSRHMTWVGHVEHMRWKTCTNFWSNTWMEESTYNMYLSIGWMIILK